MVTYREAVVWRQTKNKTIEYTGKEAWFHFAGCFFAYAFVIYTTVCILGEFFPVTITSLVGKRFLLGEILVCQLVYEQLFPRLERKQQSLQALLLRLVVAGIGLAMAVRFGWSYYENDAAELEDGFLRMGRLFVDKVNIHFHTNYTLAGGVEEKVPLAVTFALVLVIFLFFNISYILNRRKVWLALPLLLCGVYLAVGLSPQWKGMSLFCLCLYFFSLLGEEKAVLWKPYYRHNRDKRKPALAILQGLLPLGLLLFCFLLVTVLGQSASQNLLSYSPQVKEFQRNLELGVKSKLSGGDLSGFTGRKNINNKEPVYTGKEVLSLLSERKPEENLYLKDYQGGRYENGSWIQEKESFESACKKAGIDRKELQRLLAGAVYAKVAGDSTDESGEEDLVTQLWSSASASRLEIRQASLGGRSLYAPYFTRVTKEFKGSLWGDVLLRKGVLSGNTSVDYLVATPSSLLQGKAASEHEEELWDFYSNFVKQQYLEITEDLAGLNKLILPFGFASGGTRDAEINAGRRQAAEMVRGYLSGYQYSQKLSEASGDAVEYFLTVSKKGYCIHFAAAGTLLLRKMGVPARYCSGYIVKPGDWSAAEEGYEASVPDSNAHAWVEIYLEKVGWIPVEMTPGYQAGIGSVSTEVWSVTDSNGVNSSQENTPSPTEPEESESNAEESDGEEEASPQDGEEQESSVSEENEEEATRKPDTGGIFDFWGGGEKTPTQNADNGDGMVSQSTGQGVVGKSTFARIMAVIIKLLLGTAVLCLGVFLVIRRVRSYQRQIELEYQRGYYGRAVRRIHQRLYKSLRYTGKLPSFHPTDAQLLAALKKRYTGISAEEWEVYMEIVKCAVYSKNELSKEQAKVVYELYRRRYEAKDTDLRG